MKNESRGVSSSLTDRKRSGYFYPAGRLLCLLLAVGVWSTNALSEDAKRRFTVADDIELSHFGDPYMAGVAPITFSPDGRFFVVDSERGRIDLDRPESTLRVYRTQDVEQFLRAPRSGPEPSPLWIMTKSSYRNGPIIKNIEWLRDSSGFAFLAKTSAGKDQLFLADLETHKIVPLTRPAQQVIAFDIRDRNHYVYCIESPRLAETAIRESQATAVNAKGYNIFGFLFGGNDDLPFIKRSGHDLGELWAVDEGKRFQVRDGSGEPIPIRRDGQRALALSPDGRSVVTALAVRDVPPEWEAMYPSADNSAVYRIKPRHQDAASLEQSVSVSEYVQIRLSDGQVTRLTNAPLGFAAGWWGSLKAAWSSDGRVVVLPDTFMPPDQQSEKPPGSAPCTAVVDIGSNKISCVERFQAPSTAGEDEESYRLLVGVEFVAGTNTRVEMRYMRSNGTEQIEYHSRGPAGTWAMDPAATRDEPVPRRAVDAVVEQGMNLPPVLLGVDHRTGASKVIWNPNPQLNEIHLSEESVFRWKDDTGRDWIGGLYKPPDDEPGRRYPLVIQTHGFREKSFDPAGVFPSAFAAQELAAADIVVLQVEDCPIRITNEEASCQIAGYKAAIKQLAAAGLIDPDRVGIIGFSRTCYYVMAALTDPTLHLRAASITDGIILGYVQYMMSWNVGNNENARGADIMIGARPFGKGLDEWLQHSPEFNLDKVSAPLQIVAIGRQSALGMWEPYAGLSYLNKPADFVLLPGVGTHVLTNPAQRTASQTGTVDWFRFWLKGEVDPDPEKREQYDRWQGLRDLQGVKTSEEGKSEPARSVVK
jgi:dipeptidyl aminopeptidase/acylaminoacyl peptidase